MTTCDNCHRPMNEGNSPNEYECHDREDDSPTLCEAYAKVHRLKEALKAVIHPDIVDSIAEGEVKT